MNSHHFCFSHNFWQAGTCPHAAVVSLCVCAAAQRVRWRNSRRDSAPVTPSCGSMVCFENMKHASNVVKGILTSVIPVVSLQRYRLFDLECCHSVLRKSKHFKEDVHPVDILAAHVRGMTEGFSFFVTPEYSNELLFSVCNTVTLKNNNNNNNKKPLFDRQ